MKNRKETHAGQLYFAFAPPIAISHGDGSFTLKPGKPTYEVNPLQAARMLGVSRETFYVYVAAGLLERVRYPSMRRILIDAAEVSALADKMRDSEFWTPARILAVRQAKAARERKTTA
ncbi:hypothetical protein DB346_08660 [Verrucomicrobia bacterium LW23]|nr:hypothetical protein DB346_08660 [Verrucomicrobia bacterium LW23]